jgi:hypothetical protein
MLWFTSAKSDLGSMVTNPVSRDLSRVTIWEKLITDVFARPDAAFSNRMFAGADARLVFEVITAQIVVLMALRLKESFWSISTGRRLAGSEPREAGRLAHQISPFIITSLLRKLLRSERVQGRQPEMSFHPGRRRLAVQLPGLRSEPAPDLVHLPILLQLLPFLWEIQGEDRKKGGG